MKSVCVLGLGYIGLPTSSVLAANGYQVLGVDVSPRVVDTVNEGNIHIEEPGLHTLVRAAIQSGNLRASIEPEPSDVFIVAVPTPLTVDKRADMSYVERATRSLVPHLRPGSLVILESTSPPGTCRDLMRPILEESGLTVGSDISLAHCPERVLPSRILTELITNDRVIGGHDQESAERARALYASFVEGEIFLTDATTAEMVKILENTFRDVNIALANETARLCESFGIDFWEVSRFANRHPRVNVHAAGPGVGGHCISVDPWFLVEKAPALARLIRLARETNDAMPEHVVETVETLLEGKAEAKIAALGLAYKGNVDDLRESPAVAVVSQLRGKGWNVAVYDPHVNEDPLGEQGLEMALKGADLVLLLTNHDEYLEIDPKHAATLMKSRLLFDTRNALDHATWRAAGFVVRRLGCGKE